MLLKVKFFSRIAEEKIKAKEGVGWEQGTVSWYFEVTWGKGH